MLKIRPVCKQKDEVIFLERPYALLLVTSSESSIKVNGERMALEIGRVFFLKGNPDIVVEGELLIGHLIQFHKVMYHAFLIQHVIHRDKGLYNPDLKLPFADLQFGRLKYLMDMIRLLNLEMEEGTSPNHFMHQLFSLLRHVNRDVETIDPLLSDQDKILLRLNILIAEHFIKERKTKFYAKEMGMSSDRLNTFAREVMKKNLFSDVLDERLINEADLLLSDKSKSIQHISNELEFSDQNNFSTWYKRQKGCSPSDFRNSF